MLIGLTGNFGSGKSTALKMFGDMGAVTVSADAVVHDLLKTPEIKARIGTLIGDIFDAAGEVDKARVAAAVFSDPALRRKLEALIHPSVMARIRALGRHNEGRIAVAEIPLLFEGGFEGDVDVTVTVTSGAEESVARLVRKGFTQEEAARRLSAQMPQEEKAVRSDFVVDNSGDIENTRRQVAEVYERLVERL
jgi:dephospho-CoA kinase